MQGRALEVGGDARKTQVGRGQVRQGLRQGKCHPPFGGCRDKRCHPLVRLRVDFGLASPAGLILAFIGGHRSRRRRDGVRVCRSHRRDPRIDRVNDRLFVGDPLASVPIYPACGDPCPSRAACVTMFNTIHAEPNWSTPRATIRSRTMVIPSSASSWPRWFRLCLIRRELVRCLSVWHSGSYSEGCAGVHRKMDGGPGLLEGRLLRRPATRRIGLRVQVVTVLLRTCATRHC